MAEKKKKGLINKLFGFETIKQGASMTSSMFKDIMPSKKEMIKETFEKALKRQGISKSEENPRMLSLYKNQQIQFFIIFSAMLFVAYNAISAFLSGVSTMSSLLSAISFTTISFALFSVSLHYAFRCFQIRNKRLGMLKYWLSNPKEWIPKLIKTENLEKVDEFKKNNPNHLKLSDSDYINELHGVKKNKKDEM